MEMHVTAKANHQHRTDHEEIYNMVIHGS